MEAAIARIITAGSMAPSGENAQPWRFHVSRLTIYLLDDPESDISLYNFEKRGTLVAQGAAIENMVVTAAKEGYNAYVRLFPTEIQECIAALELTEGSTNDDDAQLADAVSHRTTNRKPYHLESLSDTAIERITGAVERFAASGIRLVRVTNVDDVMRLARVGSTNEEIMLGNKELHAFFFDHVTWTKKEDDRKRRGFFIKTLELPLPVQILFRAFKYWPVMAALKTLGFTKLVGEGNARINAAAAEFGILTIGGTTPADFLNAGRALERIWLIVTSEGVSLQPLVGTLYMAAAAEHLPEHFSARERGILAREVNVARETVHGATIAFMYRVGYPTAPPSASATRLPIDSLIV